MQNRTIRALLPILCICCASAQGVQKLQQGGSKEQMVMDAIRGANKSIYVVAPGSISDPIFAELVIRHKSRTKDNKSVALEIKAGDPDLGNRFVRVGAKAWTSSRYAGGQEMLVIDKSVVIKNFNSPMAAEVVKDPALAKRQIKAIKKDRKSSEKIKPDETSKWWWVFKILFWPHPGGDPWFD